MNKDKISMTALHKLLMAFAVIAMITTANMKAAYAKENSKQPYLIKVNRACNTVTIYEKDSSGNYTVPVKAMICSVGTGTRTVTGTFNTKQKYRWKLLNGNVWGQYATRIVGGILFHSVYYYGNCDPSTLATKEYNKLGTAASQGCIRLTVADAKWIYDNCPVGTQVVIYDDKKNPGPLGKPEPIILPLNVKWDPTDPNDKNPYKNKMPKITGAQNQTLEYGQKIDLLSGVKAVSSLGVDISSSLRLEGEIDYNKPGKYKITYIVVDNLKREASKTITVTVKKPITADKAEEKEQEIADYKLELKGVMDRLVNTDLSRELALSGVEAYCGKELDKDLIEVQISEIDKNEYQVTYKIDYNNKTVTEHAKFYVDKEAPEIMGVSDIMLEAGEIPGESFLLENITVSDNYSGTDKIRISARLVENADGSYVIIYEAIDEAGNISVKEAKIII